ncbi:MAG: helix-turn-helix transcriptional regulator [Muribaculaceae bacterium]
MLFSEKIRHLREEQQLPQRQLAAALEIDTATYCKIEKGDRKAKREQVVIMSRIFKYDMQELLNLWVADKVYNIVGEEVNPESILSIVAERVAEYSEPKP